MTNVPTPPYTNIDSPCYTLIALWGVKSYPFN